MLDRYHRKSLSGTDAMNEFSRIILSCAVVAYISSRTLLNLSLLLLLMCGVSHVPLVFAVFPSVSVLGFDRRLIKPVQFIRPIHTTALCQLRY